MFERWEFQHPFRKYQRVVLSQIQSILDTAQDDRRYHIVAPPGSGKTILGLELIRRLGRPALVLTPTTTIQMQWRERVRLFLPPDEDIERWVSLDPTRYAPVMILTYQRLAVQDPDMPFAEHAARREWIQDLVDAGHVPDVAAAEAYLHTLATQNPKLYRREIRRRYPRIKRRLLREQPQVIEHVLHPNARALIERLAAWDIGTVVLDECHHLLDYWAVVIRYLLSRLREPRVIGLTATLPSPEDEREYENYTAILGEVDFEVPTPAVVKEGNLAPYRDLVYFVPLTKAEAHFLRQVDEAFKQTVDHILTDADVRQWLETTIVPQWQRIADENPVLALAALRWLHHLGQWPAQQPLPEQARQEPTLDDRLTLVEAYALQRLLPSPHAEDRARYRDLRERLRPFGFTLTPRGLRQSRTPGDLVLSYSANKAVATASILAHEYRALGDRLRAVVVVDFERRTGSLQRYRRGRTPWRIPLDEEAGSARFVFRYLAHQEALTALHPVLVTGRTLWIDKEFRPVFEAFLRAEQEKHGWQFEIRFLDRGDFWEVRGRGRDWGSRTYVAVVTKAFERGLTKVLVGTRGLFGEGWDALRLNTLIDLTTVTTSVGVQQLRGRSLRKDPDWPHKVAHNWDVISVAPEHPEGGAHDLKRWLRRHQRLWGVVQTPIDAYQRHGLLTFALPALTDVQLWLQMVQDELDGQVVRGPLHVDPLITFKVRGGKAPAWAKAPFEAFTRLMLTLAQDRERTYRAWRIGEPYTNVTLQTYYLRRPSMHIRTIYTLSDTVERAWRRLTNLILSSLGLGIDAWLSVQSWIASLPNPVRFGFLVGLGAFGAASAWSAYRHARELRRLWRKLVHEEPIDAILLDMARAVFVALQESGLISSNVSMDQIRVVTWQDMYYTVQLEYVPSKDAEIFSQAFHDLFAPIVNQRYLIRRMDHRLPKRLQRGLLALARRYMRPERDPVYYPVPTVLARDARRARAFLRAWNRFVGGGELIYTRRPEGRAVLYQARLKRWTQENRSLAFTFWR
ncbi:MAG: DEAD/DEAH box helicase family protein [Chloroflexi bacterium]|nr:DEAD/DEAH box helicase family protein [Chloroflexota bacterium]